MQKITKIVGLSFEGGVGKNFFDPQYLPQFLSEGAEIFCALKYLEAHFCFEFQDPVHKIGA